MSKAQIITIPMPSDEQIAELVRRGDRAGLLQMRDRLDAALRGRTFSESVAVRVSQVMSALHVALTGDSVSLSDRATSHYGAPPGQRPDPLRGHDADNSVEARTERARRALSGQDEREAVQARAAETKRAMSPGTDDAVKVRTDEARRFITGDTNTDDVRARTDEVRRALEGR